MNDYLSNITALENNPGTRTSVTFEQKELSIANPSSVQHLLTETSSADMGFGGGSVPEDAKYLMPKKVVVRRYILKK